MKIPKGSAKTPRPKRASDELYNARRRMKREAERLQRELPKASAGAKQGILQRIGELKDAIGKLYVEKFASGTKRGSVAQRKLIEKMLDTAVPRSHKSLKTQKAANEALKGKAGKRLMSYTESLWHGITDKDVRLKKIMDWLGVKKPNEIFDAFKAKTGIDLTEVPPDEPEKYDYYVRVASRAILRSTKRAR